jgi:hypothetical protein
MLATEYARYYSITPQSDDESDSAFMNRVSNELRNLGNIIEAHEAAQNFRYDAEGGDNVMNGIKGALTMSVQGVNFGSTVSNLVGDEIAAGVVSGRKKKDIDPMMLMMLLLDK